MSEPHYRVIGYDGYRGGEKPQAIVDGEAILKVIEVEHASVTTGVGEGSPVIRRFRVRCENGERFTVIYSEEHGWEARRL